MESRIAEIEEEIPRNEEILGKLSFEMGRPEVATDPGKLQEINRKFAQTEKKIQELYAEWEKLAQTLEEA